MRVWAFLCSVALTPAALPTAAPSAVGLAAASLLACSDPASSKHADGAGGAGGARGAEADSLLDGQRSFVSVSGELRAVHLLGELEQLLHVFGDGDSKGGEQSAQENTQVIAERARAAVEGCPGTEVIGPGETADVSVTFKGCTLEGGLTVSGPVRLRVEAAASKRFLLNYALESVKLKGAAGAEPSRELTVEGTVRTSTGDPGSQSSVVELTLGEIGKLHFDGLITRSAERASQILVDGAGKLTGSADEPSIGREGVTCEPQAESRFSVLGFTRDLTRCYGNDGTLEVTRAYSCEADGAPPQDVTALVSVEWVTKTPEDGKVNAVVATSTATDAHAGEPLALALPWQCPKP
jgi:hypothetical protein